jgi:CoA-transferase family III
VLDKSAPQTSVRASGPLAGYRIVEFAGIGPGPFACMMLADMGAEVVTLDRIGAKKNMKSVAGRGRKMVELDLKDASAIAQVLDLLAGADALIEGFRPGVMERLGLGPDVVLARNPRLVYGRMTGWGHWRRPPAMTSTTSRSLARSQRLDLRTGRCRRSTWSAISAAARSISWSVCSRRFLKRQDPAGDRWSMPPCATARRR